MNITSYDEIYERFLSKIEDYDLLKEINEDAEFARAMMLDFLKGAIPQFAYTSLDFNEITDHENEHFKLTLSSMEKEILARLMVVEYLSPKLLRTEMFEQRLGSKDFKTFSPGNLLKELQHLREQEASDANTLMLQYYYMEGV